MPGESQLHLAEKHGIPYISGLGFNLFGFGFLGLVVRDWGLGLVVMFRT